MRILGNQSPCRSSNRCNFPRQTARRHLASAKLNHEAIRERELAMTLVPERYRREKKLNIVDPRLFPEGPPETWAYPRHIVESQPPSGKNLNDVAVLDGDGVVTDGVLGGYFHDFNWDIRLHRGRTKWEHLAKFINWKTRTPSDFLPYHEIGITINAGLSKRSLWESSRVFMERVIKRPQFNVLPHAPDETPVPSPFIYEQAIRFLLKRAMNGGINILASGSLYFPWAALVEGLPSYAKQYFGIDIPSGLSLIDFIIAGRPKFDETGMALQEAERPLSIGDGKRHLVEKLLQTWGVDRQHLAVYTDDLRFDRTLLELADPERSFATNIPADYEDLAAAFGYQTLRFDGRPMEDRPAELTEALHLWRKHFVDKYAARFYVEKTTIEDH